MIRNRKFLFIALFLLLLFGWQKISTNGQITDNVLKKTIINFNRNSILTEAYGVCWHLTRQYQEGEFLSSGIEQASKICQYVRSGLYLSKYLDHPPSSLDPQDLFWYDSIVNSLESKGLHWLPTIAAFENLKEEEISYERLNNYRGWLQLFSKYFSKRIHYWEVGNEMDLYQKRMGWSDSIVIEIYRNAYEGIKTGNPNSVILIGGLSEIEDHYMDNILSKDIPLFDIMNFHVYYNRNNLEIQFFNRINSIANAYTKYGKSYHIWLTETGCNTFENSEEDQSLIIPRIFLLSFATGLDKVFFYCLRDIQSASSTREQHFGLTYNDVNLHKPSMQAYETLVAQCPNGSSRPKLSIENGVYQVKWINPDGQVVYAIWSVVPTKILVSFDPLVKKVIDYNGEIVNINSNELIIDDNVKYYYGIESINIR